MSADDTRPPVSANLIKPPSAASSQLPPLPSESQEEESARARRDFGQNLVHYIMWKHDLMSKTLRRCPGQKRVITQTTCVRKQA